MATTYPPFLTHPPELSQHGPRPFPPMQTMQYTHQPYPNGGPHYQPANGYAQYGPSPTDPRLGPPIALSHHPGTSNKRLAPPHPHPSETPAKKKQSKWTGDEDRAIIELRGNGMKWEDISKHLPGRSAISCRLRFQNYLERRSEWDEEKKNKLARLYERFKKDMWEKISKEMQLPWRAAEAMHWQIGEIEMAQRANVPVFHLAGQQSGQSGAGAQDSRSSNSPPALHPPLTNISYSHTHNHSLPQIPNTLPQANSPEQTRIQRANSSDSSPSGPVLRRRADSARSVPASSNIHRLPLPPLANPYGRPHGSPMRYALPPVVTPDGGRR
ncbi:unnamed protein product [Zymoseptoria tritici ST99CH_1A5]|uniref:Myb-like domain-containing protein n=1 Tax=Zymoseptoria tritici ST99CH_1A5 TaxID=1276529 RepID=A0A1Y6L9H9_ZYMTR|nr:unnamed protein product [Zymoseptoria tritici ST99CH_1A5]